eukprot:NODE_1170_length_1064_cov_272.241379_g894_i0.p1 GENE.NODE_1170_length_1064_cov_272.241379_g894_i0~~NODE_1170_length_1064_cov_272.241379_g894_i0.p1  ORF type:complete len:303 (-),score=44.58 NODE_1170_length_1064_cov_272.241379_g894_i0:60-968(-)
MSRLLVTLFVRIGAFLCSLYLLYTLFQSEAAPALPEHLSSDNVILDVRSTPGQVPCVDGIRRCHYYSSHIHCKGAFNLGSEDAWQNVKFLNGPWPIVVVGGENTFFANVPHSPCMYRWMQLQEKYDAEVQRFRRESPLPQKYFALHLRWMENKCRWALGKAHTHAYAKHGLPVPDFVKVVFPMCVMQKYYYRRYWDRKEKFYVATDLQQESNVYRNLSEDGAVFYTTPHTHIKYTGDDGMVVDFWMLVHAEWFVGNAMSTLSLNVCGVRNARNKSCDNMKTLIEMFPCFPHPDFDKGYKPVV